MDRASLNQSLAGGYIESYEFDMGTGTLAMQVDVLENDVLSSYDLRFEKISRFLYENESRSEGDRLEFTEMRIEETPEDSKSEEWLVLISVWDITHITVQCAAFSVDGDSVT